METVFIVLYVLVGLVILSILGFFLTWMERLWCCIMCPVDCYDKMKNCV